MEGAEKLNDCHSSVKPVPTEIFILKELYLKLNQTHESLKKYQVRWIIWLHNWPNISLKQ